MSNTLLEGNLNHSAEIKCRMYGRTWKKHKGVNNTHIQAKSLLWGITFHSRSLYFQRYLGLDRMVVGLTTTDAISAYHHNVVNQNPVHDEVYSIQYYEIMLVSDLRKVDGFLWVLRFAIPLSIGPSIISIKLRSKNEY